MGDDVPLSSLTRKDLFEYLDECKNSLAESNRSDIAQIFQKEFSSVVKSLQAKQQDLIEGLEDTKQKVSSNFISLEMKLLL